jgi:hypothetical protein
MSVDALVSMATGRGFGCRAIAVDALVSMRFTTSMPKAAALGVSLLPCQRLRLWNGLSSHAACFAGGTAFPSMLELPFGCQFIEYFSAHAPILAWIFDTLNYWLNGSGYVLN